MTACKVNDTGDIEDDEINRYNKRPLPLIIGTQEFRDDTYVGLGIGTLNGFGRLKCNI